MRLLLDTCTLLWWLGEEDKVPENVIERLQDEDNEILFSVSSAWEIATKSKLGRLTLPSAPLTFVQEASELYRLTVLPIELDDAVRAGELPLHHRDPFDRMLIAQAQLREVEIVTPDKAFEPYGIPLLW